ncbi:MAG: adenosylcobinamide amidohydrolase, partial [Methanobacteriota archaeon]
ASYFQENGKIERVGGTINTILLIGADIPERTMIRAVITATEAKTAALQELMAQSRYSTGIATGSGTDGIAIIADISSQNHLTDAGKHAKLGELIGRTMMKGITQALDQQSGLNVLSQRDMMVRLSRFAVTEDDLWKRSTSMEGENRKQSFISTLRDIAPEPAMVAAVASILHIHDEIGWELIPAPAGTEASVKILASIPSIVGFVSNDELIQHLKREESVLENLLQTIAWIVKKKGLDELR